MAVDERIRSLELRLAVTEMLLAEALAAAFDSPAALRAWGEGVTADAERIADRRGDPKLTAEYVQLWDKALALAVRQLELRRRRRRDLGR